jgi:hypothetical protein
LRGSRFLKMDDCLIVEAVSSFSAPLASSGVVTGLVDPSLELLDSEEEDDDFWGVKDDVCWGGDGEDEDPYLLDWDSIGEPSERLDVTLEATPRKVKGRRELLNLESSINYDAKGASTRWGKARFEGFAVLWALGLRAFGFWV